MRVVILLQRILISIASFITICSSCGQPIIQQLQDQGIVSSSEDNHQAINISVENNLNNIDLSLQISSRNPNCPSLRISFSGFNSIKFSQLQIDNGLDGQQTQTEIPLLSFVDCNNVEIEFLNIKLFFIDRDLISLRNANFKINQGRLMYYQNSQKYESIFKLVTVDNTERDDYITIINNVSIDFNIESINVDKRILFYIQGGKRASFSDFQIYLEVSNSQITSIPEFNNQLIVISNQKEVTDIDNFQLKSKSNNMIISSKILAPLIQINSCPIVNLNNINISFDKIFFNVVSISTTESINVTNIYLKDTDVVNDSYEFATQFFYFSNSNQLEILNVFMSNSNLQVEFFYFQEIQYARIRNMNFSKNTNIQYGKFINCQLEENLSQLEWVEKIITVDRVSNLILDFFNICGLRSLGNVRGLLLFRTWTYPTPMNVTYSNFNQFINDWYLTRIFYSVATINFNITIQNYTLIIDAEKSIVSFSYAGFFYIKIQSEGSLNCFVDTFSIDVINLDKKSDFIIGSSQGTFFQIITPKYGQYTTIFRNLEIKNIFSSGFSGFAYLDTNSVIIEDSYFYKSQTLTNGGAFYLKVLNVVIKNTIFELCQAKYFGGAIFYILSNEHSYNINMEKVSIINCTAMIGGGICGPAILENHPEIQYSGNTAIFHGNNFSEHITKIEIPKIVQINPQLEEAFQSFEQTNLTVSQQRNIAYNVFFLELDKVYNELAYYIELKLFIGQHEIIITNDEIEQLNFSKYLTLFPSQFLYFDQTKSIKLNSFHFFVLFQNLPPFPSHIFQQIQFDNIQLQMLISQNKTCTSGQIRTENNICKFCENFSSTDREDPNEQSKCNRCDTSIHSKCQGYLSTVQKEFIRYIFTLNKNETYHCSYFSQHCIGGTESGDKLCSYLHGGPECTECINDDTNGIGYSIRTNSFSCVVCFQEYINIVLFGLQFIIALIIFAAIHYILKGLCQHQCTSIEVECSTENQYQQEIVFSPLMNSFVGQNEDNSIFSNQEFNNNNQQSQVKTESVNNEQDVQNICEHQNNANSQNKLTQRSLISQDHIQQVEEDIDQDPLLLKQKIQIIQTNDISNTMNLQQTEKEGEHLQNSLMTSNDINFKLQLNSIIIKKEVKNTLNFQNNISLSCYNSNQISLNKASSIKESYLSNDEVDLSKRIIQEQNDKYLDPLHNSLVVQREIDVTVFNHSSSYNQQDNINLNSSNTQEVYDQQSNEKKTFGIHKIDLNEFNIKQNNNSNVIEKNNTIKKNHTPEGINSLQMLLFYLNILYICSYYEFYQSSMVIFDKIFLFLINIYNPFGGSYFSYFKCFLTQQLPHYYSPQHLSILLQALIQFALLFLYLMIVFLYRFFVKRQKLKVKSSRRNSQNEQRIILLENRTEQNNNFESLDKDESQNQTYIKQLVIFCFYYIGFQQIENLLQGILCIKFQGYGTVTQANLILQCDDLSFQQIRIFLIFLIIFFFFSIFGIVPMMMISKKKKYVLGFKKSDFYFLFMEYREEKYLWNYCRSATRFLIMLSFYTIPLQNKLFGFFTIFFLGIYLSVLLHNNPYQDEKLLKREIYLIISGIFTLFSYILYSVGNQQSLVIQIIISIGNYQSFVFLIYLVLSPLLEFSSCNRQRKKNKQN